MRRLLLSLALLACFLPAEAAAYQTPEDVLLQQLQYYGETNYYAPNRRRLNDMADDWQREREALHPENNAASSASSSSAPPSSSPAVPSEEETLEDDTEGEGILVDDPMLLRLIRRLEREDEPRVNKTAAKQEEPLAPTGLGTPAAVGILLAGTAFTLWRARRNK